MTDRNGDEIRDLLARAMADSPEPRPWAEVERRAQQHDAPPTVRRRTGTWLAAAACTIALLAGLAAVVGSDDDPKVRDNPGSSVPSTTSTTVPASTTTVPREDSGWIGGLLDDIDVDSLRSLDSLTEGDVVVPTAPTDWRITDARWTDPDDALSPEFVEWSLEVIEARPENGFGHVLYLTQSLEPTCTTTLGCTPSGESETINGVVWETIVVERIPEDDDEFIDPTTLRARVGDRWVSLATGAPQALTGPLLDNAPIIEFLDGLRVGAPEVVAAIGEACWQCDGAGAEGDPFAADRSSSPTATTPNGTPSATSAPPGSAPSDLGVGTGRPLTELAEGDVVIPTYIPPGLALQSPARLHEYATGTSEFSFTLETADGIPANSVRLWRHDGSAGPLDPSALDDPNHPPIEIAGHTWGWNDFETARLARVGEFEVWVYLHGLDRAEAERFIEGLRATTIEQFPGPITSDGADGLSVINPSNPDDVEVVASDGQFELTAVQAGNQVCTKLAQTVVPATMTFAGNCLESTRFDESGILDLYSLDSTDTEHLILGVVDAPGATAVRVTSPDGRSVVVATGPVNQAIDGRFFLARLDLDGSSSIRLDRFTIEDVSS